MNVKDIIKLVDAGFTKAEIAELIGGKAENSPAEAPKAEEGIKEQPAAEKPAEAAPAPDSGINKEVAAALANINSTLEKLQTFALRTDTQPAAAKNDFKTILSSVYNKKE